jgi:hypothetical protein
MTNNSLPETGEPTIRITREGDAVLLYAEGDSLEVLSELARLGGDQFTHFLARGGAGDDDAVVYARGVALADAIVNIVEGDEDAEVEL